MIKDSQFVFDYFHLLHYECHKINQNRGVLYTDSPDWINNKKATINPTNKKYDKCFQYAVTISLNHEKIKENYETVSLNVLSARKEKIYPAYVSKHDSYPEK